MALPIETESAERETQMDLGLHLDTGSQDL